MRPHRILRCLVLLASFLVASATIARAQWQADGSPVCTAENTQEHPKSVSDGAGGAIITWQDQRFGIFDIYAQHVLASGAADPAWPANGRAVCTAGNYQTQPEIVGDGAGGAIVTWEDARPGSNFDIYAQHVLASGGVDPAWPANGQVLCANTGDQAFPQIASDGAGGAVVLWNDVRAGAPNIYAQHVLASGAVDPAWPVDGRALYAAASEQGGARIVSDGAGGAIATWYDYRDSNYDIYAQHVLASGAVDAAWPANGVAVCTAELQQLYPAITTDGSGGAIITWTDSRIAVFDIYAQRVKVSGIVDPLWPADGRALCTATNHQRFPQILADGSGGAIVSWEDYRGVGSDIYAQHVLGSGAVDPAWPSDGTGLCTAASYQTNIQLVSDGSGGAIATWQDVRGANFDIYAQHALASGVVDPAWPTDGAALCLAVNVQNFPAIVGDGAGGAIVAWSDARGEGIDIYASRVFAAGGVADVPTSRVTAGLRLLAPYPSPSRGEPVTITFELPSRAHVSAQVFDAAGHRVRSLMLTASCRRGGRA